MLPLPLSIPSSASSYCMLLLVSFTFGTCTWAPPAGHWLPALWRDIRYLSSWVFQLRLLSVSLQLLTRFCALLLPFVAPIEAASHSPPSHPWLVGLCSALSPLRPHRRHRFILYEVLMLCKVYTATTTTTAAKAKRCKKLKHNVWVRLQGEGGGRLWVVRVLGQAGPHDELATKSSSSCTIKNANHKAFLWVSCMCLLLFSSPLPLPLSLYLSVPPSLWLWFFVLFCCCLSGFYSVCQKFFPRFCYASRSTVGKLRISVFYSRMRIVRREREQWERKCRRIRTDANWMSVSSANAKSYQI